MGVLKKNRYLSDHKNKFARKISGDPILGIKARVNSTYPPAAKNIDDISAQLVGILARENQSKLAEMVLDDLLIETIAIL